MASAIPLLVVTTALIVLGLGHSLFAWSPIVIAAQVAAIALTVSERLSFPQNAFRVVAAPGGPVVIRTGPYRFVRHPMYLGALVFIWTAILSHTSWWSVAVGIVVTAMVAARIVTEERLLHERYPEYGAYAESTKALLPFWL